MLPKNKEPSAADAMLSGYTFVPSTVTVCGRTAGGLGPMDAQPANAAAIAPRASAPDFVRVLFMCGILI